MDEKAIYAAGLDVNTIMEITQLTKEEIEKNIKQVDYLKYIC